MTDEDASNGSNPSGDSRSSAPSTQTLPTKPSPSPTVSWNLAPTKRNRPSGAATDFVEQFLPTLQFPDQRSAVKRLASKYLECFSAFFTDSKKVTAAENEGDRYRTKNCLCKLNFQPLERVKDVPAYTKTSSAKPTPSSPPLSSHWRNITSAVSNSI